MKAVNVSILVLCLRLHALSQTTSNQNEAFENCLTTILQVKGHPVIKYNIEARMRFYNVPAVSVAIVKDGKVVLAKAYGESDLNSHRKADTTTLFHVASISKTINALGILKLVEQGKLELDKDIREYIKDDSFKETDFSKGQKITLANLLSHTGGINRDDYSSSASYVIGKKLPSITQIVKGEKPALGKGAYSIALPNRSYEYSNQGICITQKIIADLFDPDYNRLMTKLVLHPLSMDNSTFAINPVAKQKRLAKGYYSDLKEVAPWVFPCQSQGGLVSSAKDVAKTVIAIQNSYSQKPNAMLKKESIEKMLTPQLADSISYIGSIDVLYRNGLGVMLFEKSGEKYFTHSGTLDGYTSIFIGDYAGEVGAVVLINSVNARIIPEILNGIATSYNWKDFASYTFKSSQSVDASILDSWVGTYESLSGAFKYSFTKEGDRLLVKGASDFEPELLYFSSETEAYLLSRKTTFQYTKNKLGDEIVVNNTGKSPTRLTKNQLPHKNFKK
jgi:CubicO group peptidase (beta-lactamase class C family)